MAKFHSQMRAFWMHNTEVNVGPTHASKIPYGRCEKKWKFIVIFHKVSFKTFDFRLMVSQEASLNVPCSGLFTRAANRQLFYNALIEKNELRGSATHAVRGMFSTVIWILSCKSNNMGFFLFIEHPCQKASGAGQSGIKNVMIAHVTWTSKLSGEETKILHNLHLSTTPSIHLLTHICAWWHTLPGLVSAQLRDQAQFQILPSNKQDETHMAKANWEFLCLISHHRAWKKFLCGINSGLWKKTNEVQALKLMPC